MTTVLQKKAIHPIILRTTRFLDRFGNPDAFVEMNPSIFVEDSGEITILVRTVNYRKYPENQYTVYGPKARTIYHVLRGSMKDGLEMDRLEESMLDIRYDIPVYPSWWEGVEDIRFVEKDRVLACVPECNSSGLPCLFEATLKENCLTNFKKCEPSMTEKNWMPYWEQQEPKVLYHISPFLIKSIQKEEMEEVELEEGERKELEGWHGSSNGLELYGQLLFLIHKNKEERVYHRWMMFDSVSRKIKLSKPFVFFGHSYLEFVCSLAKYKGTVYVGVGVNDSKAFVVEVDQREIASMFIR